MEDYSEYSRDISSEKRVRNSCLESMLFLNGKFLSVEDACINIEDRGTLFGDGVYEYVIVYNGKPFQVDDHLDRLWHSASEIETAAALYQGANKAVYK
jgi:hypothetical protein